MNRASPPSALQLRLPGDGDPGQRLASAPESQWFDRKSARVHPRALADALIGMANADGGIIAVGFSDAGEVEGLRPDQENALRTAASRYSVPPVRHSVEVLNLAAKDGRALTVALFEVEASDGVHRNVQDEVYLRVGDQNRRLRASEAQELEYDKGQSTFDGRPVAGATLADLDAALVDRYVRRVGARAPAPDVLLARGLAIRVAEELRPTVAGMLVLGQAPQRFFPEAFVRVLEYTGKAPEVGARGNIRGDKRFEGPLPVQIELTRRYLLRRLDRAIRLGPRGTFERQRLLPDDAWLEAIVNAVVHRSYSMAGDHIRVEVFPDRFEVRSPGRLPGLVRVENIRSTRYARNPRIARAIADLGYGRELGEGVDRMFEEMSHAGLPEPRYSQHSDSVTVTLRTDTRMGQVMSQLRPPLGTLYEYLRGGERRTTTDAVEHLGRSRPTVLRLLRELEALGLARHVGSSPTDPRGYWTAIQP